MIDHRHARSLAAEAVDFPLDLVARRELEGHLASCPACAADAAGYRHDAERLAGLPAIAPPPRVHAAVFGRRRPSRLVLLAAAALLVAASVATAALIGAAIQELRKPDLAVAEPSPTERAIPSRGPTTDPTVPSSLPPTPTPPPGLFRASPASLPLADGNTTIAAAPGGSVYALVDRPRTLLDGPGSQATLALLDANGVVQPGWPIQLAGWSCNSPNPTYGAVAPVVMPDGSVRLVCALDELLPEAPARYAFAFDAAGEALPGWPVDISAGEVWEQPGRVGDALVVLVQNTVPGSGNEPFRGTVGITLVAADGTTIVGERTELVEFQTAHLASDGTAHAFTFGGFDPLITRIHATDLDGERSGWPVEIEGDPSRLVVAPDGRRYLTLTEDVDGVRTRVVVLDPAGRVVVDPRNTDSVTAWPFALRPLAEWTGAAPTNPALPLVLRDDGGSYLVGVDADGEPVVHAADPLGAALAGWPFRLGAGLQPLGDCSGPDTGCGFVIARPVLGPGGSLVLPLAGGGGAGSLLALDPDGQVRPGWPVALGGVAEFRYLAAGADGIVFAVAVGPGPSGRVTVVGVGPDGSVAFQTTVVQP